MVKQKKKFDFSKEFKKKGVDYFLKEHKLGSTPNPCVICNNEVKFGLLLKKSLSLDADFIATGRHVRKQQMKVNKHRIRYKLLGKK